jgi:diadenylate cyclase
VRRVEPHGFSFYTVTVNFDTLTRLFGRLGSEGYNPFQVGAELVLIGLFVNWCASILHGTRGARLLRGVLIILVAATLIVRVLADQFGWARFELLYRYFIIGMVFMSLVAFQPELRRALIRAGEMRFMRRKSPHSKVVSALVESAGYLSRNRYGGLIAIQRDVGLANWAENGTVVNAETSANLLKSIFFPNSALHDLGVIIRGDRVWAAGCQFPVAESGEVDANLGSRHRAAVGLSAESDALVLVVSEETGTISLADKGRLTRYLALDDLEEELNTRLAGLILTQAGARKAGIISGLWRFARRLLIVAPLTLVIWFLADQASLMRAEDIPAELTVSIQPTASTANLDLALPASTRFRLNLSGSTREVVALSTLASEKPIQLKWALDAAYQRAGHTVLRQEELRRIFEGLKTFADRGVFIDSVEPATFEFDVYEIVTADIPVRPTAGSLKIEDVHAEPGFVKISVRQSDLAALPEAQRFLEPNIAERLAKEPRNQPVDCLGVVLPTRIGTVNLLRVEPAVVDLRLRIVAEQKQVDLEKIPVRVEANQLTWQNYDLLVEDAGEWLINLKVEGDETKVSALRPEDVKAVARISGDLAQPSEDFRTVKVEVGLPEGLALVGTPPEVRFRLVLKEGKTP